MEFLVFALLWQGIIGLCLGAQSYAGAVYNEKDNGQSVPALDVERSQRFLENPADVHIFVSPSGSDTNNDGLSQGKPFKSIAKALTLVSHYQGRDVYVELLQGYHDLEKTLNIHHTDSGKLTIRALYGSGHEVHVTGGKRLDSSLFKPVTDHQILSRLPAAARSHVRVASLADINITDYGSISRYGFYHARTAPLEVFFNGEPLTLARWPNQGYINIVGLVDGANGRSFRYNSQRPASWKNEHEIWTYGFWKWSWADRAVKVQSLNTVNMTVTLAEKTTFGLTTGNWNENSVAQNGYRKQGGYFRFFNVLSELDQPGYHYLCLLCKKVQKYFKTKYDVRRHLQDQHSGVGFQCSNCGYLFSRRNMSHSCNATESEMEYVERATGVYGEETRQILITFIREKQDNNWKFVTSHDEPDSPVPNVMSAVVKPATPARKPRPRKENTASKKRRALSPLSLADSDDILLEEPPMKVSCVATLPRIPDVMDDLVCSPSTSSLSIAASEMDSRSVVILTDKQSGIRKQKDRKEHSKKNNNSEESEKENTDKEMENRRTINKETGNEKLKETGKSTETKDKGEGDKTEEIETRKGNNEEVERIKEMNKRKENVDKERDDKNENSKQGEEENNEMEKDRIVIGNEKVAEIEKDKDNSKISEKDKREIQKDRSAEKIVKKVSKERETKKDKEKGNERENTISKERQIESGKHVKETDRKQKENVKQKTVTNENQTDIDKHQKETDN